MVSSLVFFLISFWAGDDIESGGGGDDRWAVCNAGGTAMSAAP